MKFSLTLIKFSLIGYCFLSSYQSFAFDSAKIEAETDKSIQELYHTLNGMPNSSMTERINWFSAQFIGTPYVLGALGEGPNARYDQFPRYRTDSFDCDTYVNTVLSLALANSVSSFKECMRYNRYKDGKSNYIQRNHFTSIDWNKNNQSRGVLKDITLTFKNEHNQSVALYAYALINKPGWYEYKTSDTIRLQHGTEQEKNERLTELKGKGMKLEITPSNLPYIPLTALFADGAANKHLFSQIPNGAIVEIVRPNWNLHEKIGTNLNISHLGFAVWVNNVLYFRQASSQYGKVVDTPMIDYLNEARNSPTIKGINIQVVIPDKPTVKSCKQFHKE